MVSVDTDLILIKNEDKTDEVESCVEKDDKQQVKFYRNNKVYHFNKNNVMHFSNPEAYDGAAYIVYQNGNPLQSVKKILFFDSYCRVLYQNNRHDCFLSESVSLEKEVLSNSSVQQCWNYITELSNKTGIKQEDGSSLLKKQIDKIKQVSPKSVLAAYLGDQSLQVRQEPVREIIYPFGFNRSQKEATIKALTEQASIIEGPPGTGKTQTILNIIANALINNQTVAIVSNNNAATLNVLEKLEKYGLGFIAAFLGKKANVEQFFKEQKEYPNLIDWSLDNETYEALVFKLSETHKKLDSMLTFQRRQATLKQEVSEIKTEYAYFTENQNERDDKIDKLISFRKLSSEQYLNLLVDYKQLPGKLPLRKKIQYFFIFGLYSFKIFKYPQEEIIYYLQDQFYQLRIAELEKEIEELAEALKDFQFDKVMEEFSNDSMKVFKAVLAERFLSYSDGVNNRKSFSNDALQKDFKRFLFEYPVILSTTHSIRSCTKDNYLFDYVLIDESSQVDVVTGTLGLSIAKNIVVVGDEKQLPHVVTNEVAQQINEIFERYQLPEAYHYNNSILTSLRKLFPDIPSTLLQEHYRCHPRIIGFCNQMFYQNKLIVLTEEQENDKPLVAYQTVKGNHARGKMNQRQLDVILKEAVVEQNLEFVEDSVGVVAPFRLQVDAFEKENNAQEMEADTVHKYQGREKDTMILTTVVNKMNKNDFADDAHLINVAVSRAVNKLIIITADNSEFWKNTNVGNLIGYIKYHNYEVISSEIHSVFDYLYSCYTEKLKKLMKKVKHVSKYDSENLMNMVVEKVLSEEAFWHLDVVLHYPLRALLKDTALLNDEEYRYAMNSETHTDFLIFNKLNKLPVYVVEVDGYEFHANNPKQLKRDQMKDEILNKYQIPIVRMKTTGSEEAKVLRKKLENIEHM